MLTFEKVLEIFADYLTADETIEVYISFRDDKVDLPALNGSQHSL